jgi:hypothetical protein
MARIKYKGYSFACKEDIIHYEVLQYLKLAHPNIPVLSNHLQGMGFSPKNFHLLRTKKALNGWRGFPDIMVFYNTKDYSFLGLELKTKKGKMSTEQILVHEALAKSGGCLITVGEKMDISEAIKKSIKVLESYIRKGYIQDGII